MARKKRRRVSAAAKPVSLENQILGELLRRHPKILSVLDKHGITFCPGCFLTLLSPIKDAPGFHALPNAGKFLADLRRALR
ncbi:MAG: hypothetical protein ACYCPQ_03160 [Elusimicrobiota bacterium]